MLEVGDIVRPGERLNDAPRWSFRSNGSTHPKYTTLNYSSEYEVTKVSTSLARTGHQLVTLKAHKRAPGHRRGEDGFTSAAGFDARNMILVRKANPEVNNIKGTTKKNAVWIIVDGRTGSVVGSVSQPDADPETTETASPFTAIDAVSSTVNLLDRLGTRDQTARVKEEPDPTERQVDEKIATLLREFPEGTYHAYKLYKTGRLPVLPVEWTTP